MPKIATYGQPTVQSQVISQPRARVGEAPADIGSGFKQVASAFVGMKERVDTTAAEDALVQFERDKNALFFNRENGYFNTQGRNAFEGAQVASTALSDLQKKYEKTLTSDNARRMFSKTAANHVTRGNTDIMRHSSKGAQVWEISTLEAQVENAVESSSLYWDQPDALREQNVIGTLAIHESAKISGISAEALAEKIQTFDAAAASAAITAATASSAAEGQQLLTDLGGQLEGPDKVQLGKAIETKTRTEKTKTDATFAINKATALIAQYDDRGDIIDQVNQIDDADLRKRVMTESMWQFKQRRLAEQEATSDAFLRAQEHVQSGGPSSFAAVDEEGWDLLTPAQKKHIAAGSDVITDRVLLSNLLLMPPEKLKNVDPTKYLTKLAPADYNKLLTGVKVAQGKGSDSDKAEHRVGQTRTAEVTAAVNHLFGKPAKQDFDQVNAYRSLVDTENEFRKQLKGSELTPTEFSEMIDGVTKKAVEEGFFFGTNPVAPGDIFNTDTSQHASLLRDLNFPVTSQSLHNIGELLDEFEKREQQVTVPSLQRAYEQAYGE